MRAGLKSQGVAGGGVPKKHLLKGQRDSSAGREAPEMLACRARRVCTALDGKRKRLPAKSHSTDTMCVDMLTASRAPSPLPPICALQALRAPSARENRNICLRQSTPRPPLPKTGLGCQLWAWDQLCNFLNGLPLRPGAMRGDLQRAESFVKAEGRGEEAQWGWRPAAPPLHLRSFPSPCTAVRGREPP